MATTEPPPTLAEDHRRLLRQWVELVTDPRRKLDEAAHRDLAVSWADHCDCIKGISP